MRAVKDFDDAAAFSVASKPVAASICGLRGFTNACHEENQFAAPSPIVQ